MPPVVAVRADTESGRVRRVDILDIYWEDLFLKWLVGLGLATAIRTSMLEQDSR